MGLGSLWMIHLIAQDFTKIRPSAAKALSLLRGKRDLNAVFDEMSKVSALNRLLEWLTVKRFILYA